MHFPRILLVGVLTAAAVLRADDGWRPLFNGRDLTGVDDPYKLLRNAVDNPVDLLVNDKP